MKIFVIEGDLVLGSQEGGFAQDAWELVIDEPDDFITRLHNVTTNFRKGYQRLDDLVAEHFSVEREKYTGDRRIGKVRITIERL